MKVDRLFLDNLNLIFGLLGGGALIFNVIKWLLTVRKRKREKQEQEAKDRILGEMSRFVEMRGEVIDDELNNHVIDFFDSGGHARSAADLTVTERFLMGYGYLKGVGIKQDIEKGIKLLDHIVNDPSDDEKINKIKIGSASHLYHYYYISGNSEKTKHYEKIAAELDPVHNLVALGWKYENGDGVEQSYESAVTLYTEAAGLGHANAMNNLGELCETGQGTEQSDEKAFEWFAKGAELGNIFAMSNLGWMYINGYGTERSYEKAFKCWTKADVYGEDYAKVGLGIMSYCGICVQQSYEKAFELWKESAITKTTYKEDGNAVARYCISELYEKGYGVEQSCKESAEWRRKADECNNNYSEHERAWTAYRLGIMYEKGLGVEQSNGKAIEWYAKAAEFGNKKAMKAIERLNGENA